MVRGIGCDRPVSVKMGLNQAIKALKKTAHAYFKIELVTEPLCSSKRKNFYSPRGNVIKVKGS